VDKIKTAFTVVCDAGPAIHLDELGCLDLLKDFQEVLLPNTVWEEIKRHRPSALNKAGLPFVQRPG
jgi:predicted nucleic acid-binding protein